MKRILGLACGLVLASAGIAGAQAVTEVQTTTTAPAAGGNGEMMRLSQLMGSSVQLQGANNFGRVEDAVIDQNGAISYLVVSNNGRNLMLPWSEGNFNSGQRVVTYAVAPRPWRPSTSRATPGPTCGGRSTWGKCDGSSPTPASSAARRSGLPCRPPPLGPS